ncbi:hypothetical protein [Rhodococcus sp. IEGM 1330]|uniref:hypothetical protein n=1 Tax=Rhodococcus sp. IEGM 1330 TaxID=3082225 RepID=UPI002955C55A|nr:hypothetical protein [Rhodococcus sp. IEGM 1330]MDV8024803.1 hypothetical protein [Rhodococcus sp. IEGM 1330]
MGNRRPLLLIVVAVVMQAFVQGVMTESVNTSGSVVFSTLAFATAAAVFGLIDRLRVSDRAPVSREVRLSMIWMNVATAVTFLSFYVSISLIPASTTSSIESAVGPAALIVIALAVLRRREWRGNFELLLVAAMMVIGMLLAGRTWQVSDPSVGSAETVAGLLLAATAGIGMAVVVLLSKNLGRKRISPVWVTAHRFHLTYVAAGMTLLFSGARMPDAVEVAMLFVFGILAVVIPLFLLQVGVQRAEPLPAIATIALLPGLTWLTQLAAGQSPDIASLILILAVVTASVAFTARSAARVRATS